MPIEVVSGTGEGRTELGALDAALVAAGIGDYNLVEFSSVLPPDRSVEVVETHDGRYGVGTPVGVVLAAAQADEPGETVAAGVGWQDAPEGGVFYEVTAPDAATCRERLRDGLADARELRDRDWAGEPTLNVREYTVEGTGAAVVAAVFGPLDDGG